MYVVGSCQYGTLIGSVFTCLADHVGDSTDRNPFDPDGAFVERQRPTAEIRLSEHSGNDHALRCEIQCTRSIRELEQKASCFVPAESQKIADSRSQEVQSFGEYGLEVVGVHHGSPGGLRVVLPPFLAPSEPPCDT